MRRAGLHRSHIRRFPAASGGGGGSTVDTTKFCGLVDTDIVTTVNKATILVSPEITLTGGITIVPDSCVVIL